LSLFMTFVGRYPIPKRVEDGFGRAGAPPSDYETLEETFQELQAQLTA